MTVTVIFKPPFAQPDEQPTKAFFAGPVAGVAANILITHLARLDYEVYAEDGDGQEIYDSRADDAGEDA